MKTLSVGKNRQGFTLVELVVVMAIFIIVIAITGDAFNLMQKQTALQSRMAESNIEGVVGLEIMRKDIASAGFGLPWSFQSAINYLEADSSETEASKYKDAPSGIPRAVSGGDDVASSDDTKLLDGTDYLVIRSTSIGSTQAAQRWSYMNYTGMAKPSPVPLKSWSGENLADGDLVTVVSISLSGEFSKQLVIDSSGNFFTTKDNLGHFEPQQSKVTNYVYGVYRRANASDPASLRMPFNRADYYVRRPDNTDSAERNKLPRRCAPKTGILFKGLVRQNGGTLDELPLLDCVADMQVVYSLDSNSSGVVTDSSVLINPTTSSALTADEIRTDLKAVQVYVLTHEGGKDRYFTYPNRYIAVGPSVDGINTGSGRKFDLQTIIGSDWQQYRWKVYRTTVNLSNMNISTQ